MEYLQRLLMRSVWVLAIMLAVENGCNGCLEKERIALLQLKHSINFPNRIDQLPSWEEDDNVDCCHWERVECNSTTHRVIKLELGGITGYFQSDGYWHLNASILLPFESLQSLNLSQNQLRSFVGNKGIGTLSNLRYLEELDLGHNYLDNSILPSLNKLSNLKILNLARNKLNGSISAKEFGSLNNLKELDLSSNQVVSIITVNGPREESGILNKLEVLYLSSNNLSNTIWSFLGELSSIKALDLSANYGLHGDVHRLCELKTLQELDIAGTGFGGTLPWCMVNLTFLRLLDISSNRFTGNIARSPLINMTSLEYLVISDNDFEIPISFKSFFNHSKLKFIESLNNKLLAEENFLTTSPAFQLLVLCLSNSEHGTLIKSFPHFLYHQHDLRMVKLSQIGVGENFPNWLLDNNAGMETLILSHNSLGGPLVLPSHPMRNLLVLDISKNHLEGLIPYKIAISFPSLDFLNMSINNFKGNIPSSFGDMTALSKLDLSNNILSGEIPVHVAKGCRNLFFLKLSNNSLKGPILPHQNNLTRLGVLISDNNGFTEIPPNLSKSPLFVLNVSANQLVGKIPGLIWSMSLLVLTMAGNHLEGPIPIEFCQLKHLKVLDLSENNITGAVPSCFNSSDLRSIRLSKNRLHGPFPMAFQYYTYLTVLDLSHNQFRGNIPTWIGNLSELTVLFLQHNYFQGNIPKELCHLSRLNLIDLSFNNLSGNIPACVSNITFDGMGPDVDIPSRISRFQSKSGLPAGLGMVLSNRRESRDQSSVGLKNLERIDFETKRMSLSYKGIVLYLFSGINLSHNRLTGSIPPEIGNLSHIKALNLSHNNFTGTIPVTFSNLKSIESLDLSYNHLNGKIPSQLTELYSLAVFNLSYNNLSGRTPPTIKQFATFDSSSYVGNPLLCGEPLPRKCNATDQPPSTPRASVNDTEEDSGFMDKDVFYMSFAGSYVTVVLAIVAILLINPYWRRAWFHLVEVFIISCYYFVVDNLVRRRRDFLWK
ncbi:receptor-like protein 15 isoform X2 [Rhododendron vialii]|uniref:receptor-like protein 15 isoform X2 n=1 Tax=Rhododendron vialii TaxID=182163 RepID=UPI00265FABD4|nr:receptor-like protein 15 isoform X2 [Rhododendron vialii]